MKWGFGIATALASCLMTASLLSAQASGNGAGQSQPDGKKPAAGAQQQATPAAEGNAFPTDTSNVPVLPSTTTPDLSSGSFGGPDGAAASLPGDDFDPVRSPDQAGAGSGDVQELESTSDVKSLDSLLPKPGEDQTRKGKKDDALEGPPKETSKEDISVGKYYLDNKDWKAALSRFQSALVLAPDDPEVYWGLAESARRLGNFADARGYYLKVMEYDPGSKHAKDARKALEDPQIENAKAGK
jgi:tetratricopeptide (TPR) repeat protein